MVFVAAVLSLGPARYVLLGSVSFGVARSISIAQYQIFGWDGWQRDVRARTGWLENGGAAVTSVALMVAVLATTGTF